MKTTRNLLICSILAALMLPFAGCGGEPLPPGMPQPVPTEIIVMQGGNPLEDAVVRLHPIEEHSWTALGRTNASGRATIFTLDRFRGAVPGRYRVIVSKVETETLTLTPEERMAMRQQGPRSSSLPSFNLVAEEFGNANTTPLEIEAVRGTPTHTVDVGEAVRIQINDGRR